MPLDTSLTAAVLQTVHYADIFGYPLTRQELHRYLIGRRAAPSDVACAVRTLARSGGAEVSPDGYVSLPGRQAIIAERRLLAARAVPLRRQARFYARLLAALPFVRMVALTGSLAMDNARDGDIDYLIVCAPGRLWLARGMAVALVRLARLGGARLCPNYLLTENALALDARNLYAAHELVQMLPYYGHAVYGRMRAVNRWAAGYLPNVPAAAGPEAPAHPVLMLLKRLGERLLGGRIGDSLERWEMTRKVHKLLAQAPPDADAVAFTPDVCRGFFGGYSRRVLAEFARRTCPAGALRAEPAAVPVPAAP